jgi:Tol biopolymer transport system component
MTTTDTSASRKRSGILFAGTAAGALALSTLLGAPAATATLPGENGKILWVTEIVNTDQIWLADPDGSNASQLTVSPKDSAAPSWSPDGSKFVYAEDGNLYLMNANGGNSAPLLEHGQNDRYIDPAWSPDGKSIAYVRSDLNAPDPNRDSQIWVVPIDRSAPPRSMTPNPSGDVRYPTWHPDGSKIGYREQVNGINEMVTVGSDGSNPGTFIVPGGTFPLDQRQFEWSPDGSRIAFSAFNPGTADFGVYEMSATAPVVPQQRLSEGLDVSWSPEGKQLIFSGPPVGILQRSIYITAENDFTRFTETPMVGRQAAWQPVPVNNPDPLAPETTLAVDARDASKKLKIDKKYKLVREALTNGEITKVKLVCKARGSKVTGKQAKQTCAAKEKKKSEPTMTKVVAKPKCGSKVRIKAVITAQYQQADPLKWKRTWKVKKKSGPSCPK